VGGVGEWGRGGRGGGGREGGGGEGGKGGGEERGGGGGGRKRYQLVTNNPMVDVGVTKTLTSYEEGHLEFKVHEFASPMVAALLGVFLVLLQLSHRPDNVRTAQVNRRRPPVIPYG